MLVNPTEDNENLYELDEESNEWVIVNVKDGLPLTKTVISLLKPYDSWIWDESLLEWVPPITRPNIIFGEKNADGLQEVTLFNWDEDTLAWIPSQTFLPPIPK